MTIVLLYCPFPSLEAARGVAAALLNAKLVACCNILPVGESHYIWHDEAVVAPETILIAKTLPETVAAARLKILALHPYETPAILSLRAESNEPFAQWARAAVISPTP
jgi:periplasmic divalent cation tolerance protein